MAHLSGPALLKLQRETSLQAGRLAGTIHLDRILNLGDFLIFWNWSYDGSTVPVWSKNIQKTFPKSSLHFLKNSKIQEIELFDHSSLPAWRLKGDRWRLTQREHWTTVRKVRWVEDYMTTWLCNWKHCVPGSQLLDWRQREAGGVGLGAGNRQSWTGQLEGHSIQTQLKASLLSQPLLYA